MSYVIENFLSSHKLIVATPRFKQFVLYNNLLKLNLFLKLNYMINSFLLLPQIKITNLFFLQKFFFRNYPIKFLTYFRLKLSGPWISNLTKTLFYLTFTNFNRTNFLINDARLSLSLHENLYALSIRLANIKLNNKFYKNIFFYFLFWTLTPFTSVYLNFSFYLNFFFINTNLSLAKFYNNRFFPIYNI